eukprot:2745767-Rhodomonas_salina.2
MDPQPRRHRIAQVKLTEERMLTWRPLGTNWRRRREQILLRAASPLLRFSRSMRSRFLPLSLPFCRCECALSVSCFESCLFCYVCESRSASGETHHVSTLQVVSVDILSSAHDARHELAQVPNEDSQAAQAGESVQEEEQGRWRDARLAGHPHALQREEDPQHLCATPQAHSPTPLLMAVHA